jgi:hypothetical protein
MNKQLLVDYTVFEVSPQQINESLTQNNGRLIVTGVLQRANAQNQNGRVYPMDVLQREAKKYSETFIAERRALGELDHPDSSVVNLNNVSHNVVSMAWNGNDLVGTVEILNTPSGNILKALFQSGIRLGISSRGMGSVKEVMREGHMSLIVQDDFDLIAFDFVSNPSTQGAFLSPVNESVNKVVNDKYGHINRIIQNIIMEF